MCDDDTCDIDHDDDIYLDETVGFNAAVLEFVENMEGFQFDD